MSEILLERVLQEPSVWDYLEIRDQSFYYTWGNKSIFLSSFKMETLPDPAVNLKFKGKILTKMSSFANIMARRPGTEDVTFYALINSPQSGMIKKILDKKMLDFAAPPLVWRRNQIRESIVMEVKKYLDLEQSFLFLDLGCGAGFDSLEIERICQRMGELRGGFPMNFTYASCNVDIDLKWLNNHQKIARMLFGDTYSIFTENSSVFDFLTGNKSLSLLKEYDNLIVSCNGFAEFLTDDNLKKLYTGISEIMHAVKGSVHVILPFAIRNEKQEEIASTIGFHYRAKDKEEIIGIINEIFNGFCVSYTEKYSQIVLIIKKL